MFFWTINSVLAQLKGPEDGNFNQFTNLSEEISMTTSARQYVFYRYKWKILGHNVKVLHLHDP